MVLQKPEILVQQIGPAIVRAERMGAQGAALQDLARHQMVEQSVHRSTPGKRALRCRNAAVEVLHRDLMNVAFPGGLKELREPVYVRQVVAEGLNRVSLRPSRGH